MARLEAVKKVCDSVGRRMEEVVRAGEERVQELEAKGEVSVDEVVCGISIVHNQYVALCFFLGHCIIQGGERASFVDVW